MPRHPKRGHFSRSRSLLDFNLRFRPGIVERIIRSSIKSNGNEKKVRVLEIGCGEGRLILELRKRFPKIEIHGINKSPWQAMKGNESLKRAATYYKIFKKHEIGKVRLPRIHFYDATKLKFRDNHFDLIISQVAIPYFKRKDQLLEEAWRVLEPRGTALLHIDSRPVEYPDFMDDNSPRFIIHSKEKGDKKIPFTSFIAMKRKEGFDIRCYKLERADGVIAYNVIMHKNTKRQLRLGLAIDELSSFQLNRLNRVVPHEHTFWGYRSVFHISKP